MCRLPTFVSSLREFSFCSRADFSKVLQARVVGFCNSWWAYSVVLRRQGVLRIKIRGLLCALTLGRLGQVVIGLPM